MTIRILKNGEYIQHVKQDSGYIGVLASMGEVNVAEISVIKGKSFLLIPAEDNAVKEFVYVLEGKLKSTDGLILEEGDSIYANEIEESVFYNALEDTRTLYISKEEVIEEISHKMHQLNSIVDALNKKDNYTKEHSSRVLDWIPKLGPLLNVESKRMRRLTLAALFHDMGKLYVADEILLKEGKLTDEEYQEIIKHPDYGYKLALEQDMIDVAEIILQHHERCDGSGYPKGLKSDEILLEAKIIAVIDSYDAMTSDRPYRKALTKNQAIEELISGKESMYDSELVDEFVKLLNEEES